MRVYDEEDQNIEFKESWSSTELLKWICGFANAKGGRMYIGVRDDGEVLGLSNSKKLMDDIPNAIVSAFGMYDAEVNLLRDGEKKYIEIVIPKSKVVLDYKGVPYIKIGTTLQTMKGDSLRQSVLSRGNLSWDAYTVDGISVDDLDEESFRIFREEATKANILSGVNLDDRLSILKELELIEDGKLTRAAVLLFHARPYKVFPGSYVQIGRFASEADILYQDEIKGSLMVLCKAIIRSLNTNYKYNLISYDKTTRHETQPYPDVAVREGIYNALMHNDWSACQPITIKVFDLKMEISNRSVLPSGWTMENHDSMHINPLISNAFKYAGFVEKFGTGIPKMLNACKSGGNPEPEYKVYEKSISLVLKPSEKYMLLVDQLYGRNINDIKLNTNVVDVVNGVVNVVDDPNENHVLNVSDRRKRLLELISANTSISIAELALIMAVTKRTVDRDISWLKEHGYISREGNPKSGYWRVCKSIDD